MSVAFTGNLETKTVGTWYDVFAVKIRTDLHRVAFKGVVKWAE